MRSSELGKQVQAGALDVRTMVPCLASQPLVA